MSGYKGWEVGPSHPTEIFSKASQQYLRERKTSAKQEKYLS